MHPQNPTEDRIKELGKQINIAVLQEKILIDQKDELKRKIHEKNKEIKTLIMQVIEARRSIQWSGKRSAS